MKWRHEMERNTKAATAKRTELMIEAFMVEKSNRCFAVEMVKG
jgi:hypothetical protein